MTRRLTLVALLWIVADVAVHACPVCFQFEDGATARGVRAAVLVLLSVTVVVLTGVAVWLRGSDLFSTDLAQSVPDVPATSGTTRAKSVENRSDPL